MPTAGQGSITHAFERQSAAAAAMTKGAIRHVVRGASLVTVGDTGVAGLGEEGLEMVGLEGVDVLPWVVVFLSRVVVVSAAGRAVNLCGCSH